MSGCWGRRCRTPDRAAAGILVTGWISEAVWRAGGSGRDEGGRGIGQELREAGAARTGAGEGEEGVGQDTG